jgi:hypothetical protein
MDLVPDHGFDDNLFALNPDWAYHLKTGGLPEPADLCGQFDYGQPSLGGSYVLGSPLCSGQPVALDGPGFGTAASVACPLGRSPHFGSFHGHVNWEPATYEGTLKWEEHSSPGTDDDYSLGLRTTGGAGATAADPAGIHLEFDSDETIDHFDGNAWWKQFHEAVDAHGAKAGDLIDGDQAVVTGLAGLDTAHTPALESHPVYAMALQTDRKSAVAGATDQWALFARSWGNEGFCSQYNHTLPPGPLTIRIPWQNGATGVLAGIESDPATQVAILGGELSSNIGSTASVVPSVVPGEGVLFTFDLSVPASHHPLYWGTIDLKWTFGPRPVLTNPQAPAVSQAKTPASSPLGTDEEDSDVEALLARAWNHLPPRTRAKALALLPHQFRALASTRVLVKIAPPPTSPLRPLTYITSRSLPPAPQVIALGRAERRVLCKVYRNHVPRFRGMCPAPRR